MTDLVALDARDGVLTLRATTAGGTPVNNGAVALPHTLLASLGWPSGTVVEVHTNDDGSIRVVKSPDPLSVEYSTHHRGVAVPPGWLMQTVVGSPDTHEFVHSSYKIAEAIVNLVRPHLGDRAGWRVLDFGCGCGRVSRALPLYSDVDIVGCDLQEAAINWCNQWLDGAYVVGQKNPPLDLAEPGFDLLIAISVLTHLSADDQDGWLAEWARLMRPGGILFVTFRSQSYIEGVFPDRYPDTVREAIQAQWERTGGIAYASSDYWVDVFPDYYGDAYHTDDYVRSHWGRFFDVLDIVRGSRGSAITQDTAILRARQ